MNNHIPTFESFLNESKDHKLGVGDWVEFDNDKARVVKVYYSRSGEPMYTIGSSKHGNIDVEAADLDENHKKI